MSGERIYSVAEVIPPSLDPLRKSYEADDVEADLKAAVIEVFESMLRAQERRINSYAGPHRGSLETLERFVKFEGLALERKSDREAYMRELFRGWRARNPKRGTQFLRYYLQLLFPGEWTLQQLWHTPADTYPEGASSSPGPGRILTSRLKLGLVVEDVSTVDQLIASFRAVVAARFVLETTILQRIAASLRMAAAMDAAEVQTFVWEASPGSGAPTPPPPPPPPPPVPAAPTIGTTTAIGTTSATINWTDSSSDETGFRVQLETPSGAANWADATGATNPTAANATSFAATGLTAGTQYRPRVRAEGAGAPSAWSTGTAFSTAAGGGFDTSLQTSLYSYSAGGTVVTRGVSGAHAMTRSLQRRSAGKRYFACTLTSYTTTEGLVIGLQPFATSLAGYPGTDAASYAVQPGRAAGLVTINGNNFTGLSGSIATIGDTAYIAVDFDAGKIWYGRNGVWHGGGDPAAGTGQAQNFTPGTEMCVVLSQAFAGVNTCFLASGAPHAPPSGFSYWEA